ncbi:molybdenum cofactor biosynthesis protein, partial [Burkholderia multivorans]
MKNEHVNVKLDRTINAAVLTVSDTRTKETDKGGNLAKELLSEINVEITDDHYT